MEDGKLSRKKYPLLTATVHVVNHTLLGLPNPLFIFLPSH